MADKSVPVGEPTPVEESVPPGGGGEVKEVRVELEVLLMQVHSLCTLGFLIPGTHVIACIEALKQTARRAIVDPNAPPNAVANIRRNRKMLEAFQEFQATIYELDKSSRPQPENIILPQGIGLPS